MPNFSSQAKSYIQTIIRNQQINLLLSFIISEPSHEDWGLIIINKLTYIAKKIVELQPYFLTKFKNHIRQQQIDLEYQNKYELKNRFELLTQLLQIMQLNNKHIDQAQRPKLDHYQLNTSAPEYFRPSSNLNTCQPTFQSQNTISNNQYQNLNLSTPNTQIISLTQPNKQANNIESLKDKYQQELDNLPYHNKYFPPDSDSDAVVSDLSLNEDYYEGGQSESLTHTVIEESPKHQQDFNRIPILKFFLLNSKPYQLINNNKQQNQTLTKDTTMANVNMLDKDNGEINIYKKPDPTGFNAAINNLELAAGNGTKIDSKYYYQMMELREQILSIRIQAASSITAEIIGNYFETVEDILDRSYTQMIKVLSNPNVPKAIVSFIKIIDKHMSYDKNVIKDCQHDDDSFSNTHTLKFKVAHNYIKPLQSDILQFIKSYFKTQLTLGLIKFSIKTFNILPQIKIKHTADDKVIIQRPNLRRKNLRPKKTKMRKQLKKRRRNPKRN